MAAGSDSSTAPAVQDLVDEAESLCVCHATARHGLGVRTLIGRLAGEVIHRFSGVIGPELRQHSLQVAADRHISETRFIGYLSHSCDPNCRLDMERFELVALKDVPGDDLLTIDYAVTEDMLYRQFDCHCEAAACRRWITGRAEQVNAEGLAWLAGELPPPAQ